MKNARMITGAVAVIMASWSIPAAAHIVFKMGEGWYRVYHDNGTVFTCTSFQGSPYECYPHATTTAPPTPTAPLEVRNGHRIYDVSKISPVEVKPNAPAAHSNTRRQTRAGIKVAAEIDRLFPTPASAGSNKK